MTRDLINGERPAGEEPPYEWDYDDEGRRGPRILWGRVAALTAIVILAFVLGWVAAPASTDTAELERLRERLAETNRELRQAQQTIEGLESRITATPTSSPSPETTEGDGAATGTTYEVESGDTLRLIAERFYGDASLASCIAQANGLTTSSVIQVGQRLEIPDESDC